MGVIAAVLLAGDLAAFAWLVRAVRWRPLPFALAIGLALLVCWQSMVVGLLSAFSAVNGPSLGAVALVPPLVALGVARSRRRRPERRSVATGRSLRRAAVSLGAPGLVTLPLAGVLLAVALAHAPSNWDSMTYHLARVAHWIQRGSVAPYATNVYRQTLYAPGAEYLLLALQAISGSDRLANLLQWTAWVVVAVSAAPLARLGGAPRRVARWMVPLVASAPMLVLQATSTQNDLVAAALAVAVASAALPFLHRRAVARPVDLLVVSAALSGAFLVKATAVLAAAPFVAFALPGVVRVLRRRPPRKAVAGVLAAALVAAGVVGPFLHRSATADARAPALTTAYVLPALGEWETRAANFRGAFVRHLQGGTDALSYLSGEPAPSLRLFHEDLASNPVQAAFVVTGLALLVALGGGLPRRARWAGAGLLLAWALFQWIFRANLWISRLETPLFALAPLACPGWGALRPRSVATLAVGGTALVALALGTVTAIHNRTRPVAGIRAGGTDADDYYVNRPGVRPLHDAALDAAARIGCRRMGLLVTEDSYDYPLTWRAMQRGIEVRHVLGPDPWPCLLVSDRGPPPDGAGAGSRWQPVALVRRGPDGPVTGGVWARRP